MKITTFIDSLPTLTVNEIAEPYCACQTPCDTSCTSAAITAIICAAILIIAIAGIIMFYKLKNKEREFQLSASSAKWAHEKAEREAKQAAEEKVAETKRAQDLEDDNKKRERELENLNRERELELTNMYLSFMENLTQKENISEADKNYMTELKKLINEIPKKQTTSNEQEA